MKVALLNGLCSIPSKEAESVFSMKMCEAYADKGNSVTLFVSKNSDEELPSEHHQDVYAHYQVKSNFSIARVPVYKSKLGLMWSLAVHIPFLVKINSYDLIHCRNLATAWGAVKFMNKPVIYEIHNAPDSNKRALSMFQDFCRSKNCKMIIAITHALASHIRQFMPSDVPVLVLADGVSSSSLNSLGSKEELRAQLEIELSDKTLAVYTGHLYRGRGIELIIELASRLTDTHTFCIAGGRKEDIQYYQEQAKALPNLFFTGHKSQLDVVKYQQAADVLLMPYDYKVSASGGGNTADFASPMKMFEYMAAGRPMISSTLPILYEVLKDKQNALMVPYENIEAWQKALEFLRANPEEGDRIGLNAKNDAEMYTWSSRVETLIKNYQAAAGFQSNESL